MAKPQNTAAAAEAAEDLTETPGVSEDAEKIDTPLALSGAGSMPRDALLDPQEGDIIPDNEEKGYHVGMVRQPAELVGVAGKVEGFRSTSEHPSKFAAGSLQAHKAAHNAAEKNRKDTPVGPAPAPAFRLVRVEEG